MNPKSLIAIQHITLLSFSLHGRLPQPPNPTLAGSPLGPSRRQSPSPRPQPPSPQPASPNPAVGHLQAPPRSTPPPAAAPRHRLACPLPDCPSPRRPAAPHHSTRPPPPAGRHQAPGTTAPGRHSCIGCFGVRLTDTASPDSTPTIPVPKDGYIGFFVQCKCSISMSLSQICILDYCLLPTLDTLLFFVCCPH
jgi:hypothetical protein